MQHEHRRFDALKRAFDISASTIGLIITAPVQVGVSAVVLATHGRPVLFRQERPGKHGEIFQLVKFRTMLLPDENHVTDEERLTAVGRFLRSTSLDELPTLWNVLKGDMSLIGPRPLRVSYLDHYSPEQARRHEVRPGVTGLAQVQGRNSMSWEKRFKLDIEYVDSRSFALDVKILIQTVSTVLRREGINREGHATMPSFTGSIKNGENGG
ncbi:sugar transferase [Corynebacterium sp. YIM 101645]|uniref:Sugar transferase n=1 Tax=Corynebacterium lemuris TaxID=1859292 RepID=A0ABT2FZY3_9CORY|nr:sugar transferase [Corynebacterium lemuris]MCS5480810.1 sugar transferase [Corynebacterium lemuris]